MSHSHVSSILYIVIPNRIDFGKKCRCILLRRLFCRSLAYVIDLTLLIVIPNSLRNILFFSLSANLERSDSV